MIQRNKDYCYYIKIRLPIISTLLGPQILFIKLKLLKDKIEPFYWRPTRDLKVSEIYGAHLEATKIAAL